MGNPWKNTGFGFSSPPNQWFFRGFLEVLCLTGWFGDVLGAPGGLETEHTAYIQDRGWVRIEPLKVTDPSKVKI